MNEVISVPRKRKSQAMLGETIPAAKKKHRLVLRPGIRSSEIFEMLRPKRAPSIHATYFNSRGTKVTFFNASNHHQRSIVKAAYTKNTKTRSWAAHGQYLQREQARHISQGIEQSLGFSDESDNEDLKQRLKEWQRGSDEYFFKFIVSPENGHRMNLKQHALDLMTQMKKDLGTELEWVAIEHQDTDHPHLHILVRGRDDKGKNLLIFGRYLSNGIRHRSQELATRELGLRLNVELDLNRKQSVQKEYVVALDRGIVRQAERDKDNHLLITFSTPLPREYVAREIRLSQIERLHFLETLGLARKVAPKTWSIDEDLLEKLKERQLKRDIIKTLAKTQDRALDIGALTPTKLHPQQKLLGRVIGMGLEDELYDKRYLLLDGIDGKVHYLSATNSIVKSRDMGEFANGDVISLSHKTIRSREGDREFSYVHVDNHHSLDELKNTPDNDLNLQVIQFVRQHKIPPGMVPDLGDNHTQSFGKEYKKVMQERFLEFEERGFFEKDKNQEYELANDYEIRLRQFNYDLTLKRRQEISREIKRQQERNRGKDLDRGGEF